MELDRYDRAILRLLQQDARITNTSLAEKVNLSESACLRRVRTLEESGLIQGYTALIDQQKAGYPVLVAVNSAEGVLGYASLGDWRAWDGYRHTVEHSVYVRADQRGKGVGEALMHALIKRARRIGKHVMVAGIEAKNAGSIRLHEKLGFEHVGHLKQVGTKFGCWLDLLFLQLILDERTEPDRLSKSEP